MKKMNVWTFGSLAVFVGSFQLAAQDVEAVKKDHALKVQRHTVMEQYEPELILSIDERIRLKEERLATLKRRKAILDTMDISDRRRQRLLKALLRKPASDRIERAIADIEFAENEPEE